MGPAGMEREEEDAVAKRLLLLETRGPWISLLADRGRLAGRRQLSQDL